MEPAIGQMNDTTENFVLLGRTTEIDEAIEALLNPPDRGQPVYIDDLIDAVEIVVNGSGYRAWFKPKPGEQVVIERWHERRWMGTNLYTVRQVNVKTGDIVLKDEVGQQAAMANYVTGVLKHGWRFKLPVPGLRLDKREAPKVEVTLKVERPANPDGTKSKGRPKGSKNRSSEEISTALHEKMLEKQTKRDARDARKKK